MATLLGTTFSINEKVVLQCDNQTLGSTIKMLVIQFNQEKFKQLLFTGKMSPLSVRKHRKIVIDKALLTDSWKQVSVETSKLQASLILSQAR